MGVRGPSGMPALSRRSKILIGLAVVILVVLLVGPRAVGLYTDILWFRDVGFGSVLSTIIWTRIVLFVVAAVVAGAMTFSALALAYHYRPVFVPTSGDGDPIARYRTVVMSKKRWFSLAPALIIGILAGIVAQGSWQKTQLFLHSTPVGKKDPQFGYDLSFFNFELPFYRHLVNFLFVLLVVTFVFNLLAQYVFGGIHLAGRGGTLSKAARIQLAAIAGLFVLLKAVAYWFDRYALLSSDRKGDIFTGLSYTDAHAVLPAKLILLAIAVICGLAFFAGVVLRDLRIPALSTALMLLSALIIGVAWPLSLEQFSVKPNAAQKEAKYIQRNIDATKDAYQIGSNKVTYQDNWTAQQADPKVVDNDAATLSNLRLLDPNVVGPAFTQLQKRKNFYGFPSQLAMDRYTVNGQLRDYVVSVRELDPQRYDGNQSNWLNKHTVYTHGDGFVAAPANRVDEPAKDDTNNGGSPIFDVSDVSSIANPDYAKNAAIKVKQPRIYFGELISKVNPDYAIVGSDSKDAKEYDGEGARFSYDGGAGVPVGNFFNRIAFGLKYTERNFLLSDAINSKSKVIFNRDPRDRVKKVAPWLTVDSKTYPAVMKDGSIKWIVDGYTTLDNYPYSQKMSLQDATNDAQQLNRGQTGRAQANKQVAYVRNSVKATVDAYTGKVTLYQFDDKDPVLKTWMKAFPKTVKPRADFDKNQSLKEHVRYPEDLFKIQRSLLSKYHVDNPATFFEGNGFWSLPADPTRREAVDGGLDQPPYYFIASDPRSPQNSSFQLTSVMNVLKNEYLAAYISASSNPDSYGQITVKEVPQSPQREGPKQAFGQMSSFGEVNADIKNFENNASPIYGNLLTIPVGKNGLLNIVPLYTQAKANEAAFPRLFRMIVRYRSQDGGSPTIGYAPTIAGALKQAGISPATATGPQDGGTAPTNPAPTPQPGDDNKQQQGSAGGSNGGNNVDRDAAVNELNAALDGLEKAQGTDSYADALKKLSAAVKRYESLPK